MELKVGMRIRVDNPKSKHNGKKGEIISCFFMKGKYARISVRFRNQVTEVITTTGITVLEGN